MFAVSYLVYYDTVRKCDRYFITIWEKSLLQNESAFFIKRCNSSITKCDSYYKCDDFITKCYSYYKMRWYMQFCLRAGENKFYIIIYSMYIVKYILWRYVYFRTSVFTYIYVLPWLFENQWVVVKDKTYMKMERKFFDERKDEWCSHAGEVVRHVVMFDRFWICLWSW